MKIQLLLMLLVSGLSLASIDETRTLLEKTFVRDNTFCKLNKKFIEIEIRSFDQYSIPEEQGFGRYILTKAGEKNLSLTANADRIGRYKLFKGTSSNCTKALSIQANKNVLAILLLKDQRPLTNTLSILFFDSETLKSKLVDTSYSIKEGRLRNGKLELLQVLSEEPVKTGAIKINNDNYIYKSKKLNAWVKYDGSKFMVDPDLTYNNFEGKKHLPTRLDFDKAFKWDAKKMEYQQLDFILAIDHKSKIQCLAFHIDDFTKTDPSNCL